MSWEPPFMGWGSLANPPAPQLTRRVDLPAGGAHMDGGLLVQHARLGTDQARVAFNGLFYSVYNANINTRQSE